MVCRLIDQAIPSLYCDFKPQGLVSGCPCGNEIGCRLQAFVSDRAFTSAGGQSCKLGQNTAGVARFGLFPCLETRGEFFGWNAESDGPFFGVNGDGVAIFHHCNWAANEGFRGDVTDHKAMAAAGETAIGDEGHVLAQALAHDGGGRAQHLSHAGAAFGAFHADDDDVAFFDFVFEDGVQGFLFGLENNGFAGETEAFFAGDFADGTLWAEVAFEDHQVAVFLDGILEWANDRLAFWVADF